VRLRIGVSSWLLWLRRREINNIITVPAEGISDPNVRTLVSALNLKPGYNLCPF